MSVGVGLNGYALDLSFCLVPTPILYRGKGAYRAVRRCAAGKVNRCVRRGIDPGFIRLKGGTLLHDAGVSGSLTQPLGRLGAYLIRRRLCESNLKGLLAHSDDQFLTWGLGRFLLPLEGVGLSPVPTPLRSHAQQTRQ